MDRTPVYIVLIDYSCERGAASNARGVFDSAHSTMDKARERREWLVSHPVFGEVNILCTTME